MEKCLNQDQDGRASSVNKISLPNLPSLKPNMLSKNKVNVLKKHKIVLKAGLVKDLDLLT